MKAIPALLIFALAASSAVPGRAQERAAQGAAAGVDLAQAAVAAKARDFVEIHGNTSFPETELDAAIAEQLREIREGGMTPARADDAAYYIGAYYRKKGFAKASTDYRIAGKKVIVTVQEGPRSLLKKVTFVGHHAIPEKTLYDYMIGATPERLEREPAAFPYTEAEIASGGDRVRGLYLSEGFLNAKVDTTGLQLSEQDTRASITVHIVEGVRYTFGPVRFAGETVFPRHELVAALGDPVSGTAPKPADVRRLRPTAAQEDAEPYRGVSFSPGRVNALQRNLQSYFKGRGYFQAEVGLAADYTTAKNGVVPVTFTIHPAGIYHFGGVEVEVKTPKPRLDPAFLAKRFAPLKGEVWDPEKLDESYREMLRTGLFSTLRVSSLAQPGHEVLLKIAEEEAKSKEIGFTLGYGSYDGATAGVRLADRDLFGHGRPLTFSFDYSQRGNRGELLYLDPWLLDSRFGLKAKLYSVARDEIGYSKTEVGGRVDLTRRILPHLEVGVFVEDAQIKTTNVANALADEPLLLGPTDYNIASIGLTQLTDYRDNAINPGRGAVLSSSFDYAFLGGEPAFARATIRFSYYLPLGRTLLAFGARGGYIASMVDSIPIDVRFYNGGSTTVRSFTERQLGPMDRSGDPLGGDLFTILNLEYTFPVYQALLGAVFVDAGSLRNLSAEAVSDTKGSNGELRYALGLGLRYKLPIGPLRLDYGVNPDPKPGEAFGAFHFSFGFAF